MYKYFSKTELQCKCCGEVAMNDEFMTKVVALREILGEPIVVNSAYRCPNHNQAVGTSGSNGSHAQGRAIDIKCKDSHHRFRLLELILGMGFKRIGIADTFIHIDDADDNLPSPRIWKY